MLSCLKLARKTTKDRRVGSSLLTRLFYRASAPFVTALTERAGSLALNPSPPGISAKRVRKGMKTEQLSHRAVQKSEESEEQKEVRDAKERRGVWGDSLHTGPPTF